MTLKELKEWVIKLPEEFDNFIVVNGEFKEIDDEYWYRIDKEVTLLSVDNEHQEILVLNDVQEEETSPTDINESED